MPKSDLTLISGEYARVADRITLFYQRYPEGRIITELVSRTEREVMFRAAVYRAAADVQPAATGWALEREGDGDINEVACLENTETSAIGRALPNLGFTASSKRPSVEEMEKAARARARQRRADAVSDVLPLLRAAEQCGLRPRRAEAIRRQLLADGTPSSAVDGIARILRRWVERHFDREIQSLLAAPRKHP